MNVLVTTDVFPPGAGGSGRSTATLASALARRGHRVRVVVSRRRPLGQNKWNGVEVAEVVTPEARFGNAREREEAFASGMKAAAGERVWDLAHAQHWLSSLATRRAFQSLPLVVTVRDYWPVCIWSTKMSGRDVCPGCSFTRRMACVGKRRPWLWPVSPLLPPLVGRELERRRKVLRSAKAVVAVSRFVATSLALDGVDVDVDVHVVPNIIETSPEMPRPDDVPEKYVLFVGKLEPGKAPDRLLPILEAAGCELPLVVAGTGSLERELRARAEGRFDVRFLGWVDEDRTLALIRHAAALLFPSRWQEPLSRVLLDALSLGAVIVAEPTGGTEEIVVDGKTGLLGRNVEEMARALARVVDDEALASKLRGGARERARSVFSEDAVVPRIESLYRGVAAT
jgi:glycogen synthase